MAAMATTSKSYSCKKTKNGSDSDSDWENVDKDGLLIEEMMDEVRTCPKDKDDWISSDEETDFDRYYAKWLRESQEEEKKAEDEAKLLYSMDAIKDAVHNNDDDELERLVYKKAELLLKKEYERGMDPLEYVLLILGAFIAIIYVIVNGTFKDNQKKE